MRSYDGRCAQLRRSVCTVGVSTDSRGRAATAAVPGVTWVAEPGGHPMCPSAFLDGGGPGKAGARMTRAVQKSMRAAGRERTRAFTAGVLGPGHPCGQDAALPVSELSGNSVRHGGSGAAGETVAVRAAGGVVRAGVTDRSGRGMPQLRPCSGEAEGGQGPRVVAARPAVTWFELQHG